MITIIISSSIVVNLLLFITIFIIVDLALFY